MMKNVLKSAEKFVLDNSPGILTGLGVAGVVTTAILTGKAVIHADRILEDHVRDLRNPDGSLDAELKLSNKEVVEMTWKEFVPPVIAGATTIAAVIGANSIGSRRAAAITAAFKLSEELSQEYKRKVVQTLGLQKEETMRSELAADKLEKNPPPTGMIVVAGSDVLFYDELSGRYFHNQLENVKKAVNDINYKVNNYYCSSLTDFYEMLGLESTKLSDELGWNSDELLEVEFTATLVKDKPAIVINYNTTPIRGFDRCS